MIKKNRVFIAALCFLLLVFVGVKLAGSPQKTATSQETAESSDEKSTAPITTETVETLIHENLVLTQEIEPQEQSPPCKASMFYCIEDGTVLHSENEYVPVAPASLTKLLTACVALKYASPHDVYTVGSELYLVQPYSSLSYIYEGYSLKLYDLITGMLLASGNDAAYTIAVGTARAMNPNSEMTDSQAVSYFCGLMNEFASDIGMKNSHFVNPDGWDDDEQYSTASDLLLLAEYALTVPDIRTITGTREKTVVIESGESVYWHNSNYLLDTDSEYYSENATGMKTGTTLNAGNSLIASFIRNGKTYISVVVGCDTDEDRYELTLKYFSAYAT